MKNTNLKYGIRYKGNEKEYSRINSAARRRASPVTYLLNIAKCRARKRGLEFSITKEDLIIPSHCPVFGIPLAFSEKRRSACSYSLDRLDNSKGYVPGNVKVVSFKANQYKGDMTIEEVRKLLAYMEGNVE